MPDLKTKVALITAEKCRGGAFWFSYSYVFTNVFWPTLKNPSSILVHATTVFSAVASLLICLLPVLVVPGDVSVVADVANVVQKTVKHFGKIDILVASSTFPPPRGRLRGAKADDCVSQKY
ncbi:hypothetical protein HPB52_010886 [Rhipicephalus sanguineus]|uniref:Uncharacterized protein n=1 Tax=Rhipicephalus sanguineus TaxID=34632 RepID=A0A9D4PVM7_RHISA|nr:hypothetical protein HPB52_010886 [Rhipicephalus sanguineus]